MTDTITKKKRRENMRRITSKNTKPEMVVRKLIWSLGYRYRLHAKDIPGKPDLIFKGEKKVIFVNGCFWHQHNDRNCKIVRKPKSNTVYWEAKLKRNKERDQDNQKKILDMGWSYLVIWECEIKDRLVLEQKVQSFLK